MSSLPLADATVFVVDDDSAMRRSLVFLAESVGWRALGFADAESFLTQAGATAVGCLVLDVRMPTMSGLELQQAMNARGLSASEVSMRRASRSACSRSATAFSRSFL